MALTAFNDPGTPFNDPNTPFNGKEETTTAVVAGGFEGHAGRWIPYPFKPRKKKKRKNTLAAVLALLLAEED